MKVIKFVGGAVAVMLVILAGGVVWLLYRLNTYDPAWSAVDANAKVIARKADLAVAPLGPGEYPTTGLHALTGWIANYGGTVRASQGNDNENPADPHAWADAEMRGGADGQMDHIVCVRFELRWQHDTTWHRIDCP
ncbi:hypothetical protein BJY16_005213 [Actinoplanes octamycinicus]|uniref:Uncharacterized protein n=1 Tax=Actinoplanes octamycinicus TaxID=135948 RepID=A0A7W7M996_9ACTN|nr:hypothetical protein [Actinoplanes octamycinicus]MBB4741754.1 hypothetical protein [Actinoplanes octamycinicus]GIE57307.1 hypothetical protein Aoc01nite_27090 [Actinoplanes octamycinicus]